MIITKLVGGLGNQMFQYAAGRRAALANKTVLKLDISSYKENGVDTPRQYMLDIFRLEARLARASDIKKIRGSRGTFLEKVMANRFPLIHKKLFPTNKKYLIENPHHRFESRVLQIQDDAFLDGWWQSEKYFTDIANIIKEDFEFRNRPDKKNQQVLARIKKTNSVSLHIRRGDYVANKNYRGYFAQMSLAYYRRAVKLITKKTDKVNLFVFSDDPEWVHQNFHLEFPTYFVSHNVGIKDYEDLRLMAACRHQVIANSSFSWWGAWLNANPKKIVVAPKKWFSAQEMNSDDRIPKSWVKI